jgi:hypothetical protein
VSGDDDREDRPRLSWSEIDRRRDRPRGRRDDAEPRGPAATARSRAATASYLRKLDQHLFAKDSKASDPASRLAGEVRDALGTPALTDACRAYLAEAGVPADPALLSAFLDARDRAVQLAALGALADPERTLTSGLRAQLRTLAEGLDDELAEAAEAALAGR